MQGKRHLSTETLSNDLVRRSNQRTDLHVYIISHPPNSSESRTKSSNGTRWLGYAVIAFPWNENFTEKVGLGSPVSQGIRPSWRELTDLSESGNTKGLWEPTRFIIRANKIVLRASTSSRISSSAVPRQWSHSTHNNMHFLRFYCLVSQNETTLCSVCPLETLLSRVSNSQNRR